VWDAETGECLEVICGNGDVAAIAAGSAEFPWRALSYHQATIVENSLSGRAVAYLPVEICGITFHPNGRTWAGASGNHLCIISLECGERV
jgi:hypothetical protein